jgi:arylsulfatase A-like enzyme
MRRLRRVLLAGLGLPVLFSCGGDASPGPAGERELLAGNGRPVILISIDSLRADHCTPYGRVPQFAPGESTTPFLARMAAEGVLWENASAPTAWTLPSHLSLLFGMPPQEHAVHVQAKRPPLATPNLAGRFQEAGYRTAGFFSAPYLHPVWGFGEGFDTYVGAASYLNALDTTAAITSKQAGSMEGVHENADSDSETAEQVIDHALAWLEEGDRWDEPFFLFLHLWDPHYDYQPPAEYAARFHPGWEGMDGVDFYKNWKAGREYTPEEIDHAKALYDAEIRYTDDHIARLFAALEARGLADEVVLAVVSDHGDEFYEHELIGHHKTLYEEVVHVPMVVRAPGLAPAGVRVAGTAPTYDLASTLLDLAELEPWPDRIGRSLRGQWEGAEADRDVVMQLNHPGQGIFLKGWRRGDDKLLFQFTPAERSYRHLYDLGADPGELAPRALEQWAGDPAAEAARDALQRADAARRATILITDVAQNAAFLEELDSTLSELGYVDDED